MDYKPTIIMASAFALVLMSNNLMAKPEHPCGSLENHYGPFDYTNAREREEDLPIVENAHFPTVVEQLIGRRTTALWWDLDYVLRASPNHHRALYAMARYQLKTPRTVDARYLTAECYFDRASRFRPQDATVYLLWGIYLHQLGKHGDALEKYKKSEELDPKYVEVHYNLGLLYLDMEDVETSKKYALFAYQNNYPLPGLRERLKRKGIKLDTTVKSTQ